MQQDKKSRYAKTPLVKLTDPSGREFELVELREIPRVDTVFAATPEQGERLDLLAQRYYREPLLYWKICDASDHLDPLDVVATGTPVAVPPNK
jgi:hypothetical protein